LLTNYDNINKLLEKTEGTIKKNNSSS